MVYKMLHSFIGTLLFSALLEEGLAISVMSQ